MAKEFKAFEKRWSRVEISDYMDNEGALYFDHDLGCADVQWSEAVGDGSAWCLGMMQWSMTEIRHCVYEAEGFEEWQKFRIALKRLSTREKLISLGIRWNVWVDELIQLDQFEPEDIDWRNFNDRACIERCRIENYINALKRGGQLNVNGVVVR